MCRLAWQKHGQTGLATATAAAAAKRQKRCWRKNLGSLLSLGLPVSSYHVLPTAFAFPAWYSYPCSTSSCHVPCYLLGIPLFPTTCILFLQWSPTCHHTCSCSTHHASTLHFLPACTHAFCAICGAYTPATHHLHFVCYICIAAFVPILFWDGGDTHRACCTHIYTCLLWSHRDTPACHAHTCRALHTHTQHISACLHFGEDTHTPHVSPLCPFSASIIHLNVSFFSFLFRTDRVLCLPATHTCLHIFTPAHHLPLLHCTPTTACTAHHTHCTPACRRVSGYYCLPPHTTFS